MLTDNKTHDSDLYCKKNQTIIILKKNAISGRWHFKKLIVIILNQ